MRATQHIGILIGGILLCWMQLSGCYSFRGISIPAEAETFFVSELATRVPSAPSDIGLQFSETLKQKLLNESRLNFSDIDPDISFSGEVTRFAVTSVAPQPGEVTAFSRLEIAVRMKYEYRLDEEENWESSFSFYNDYDRDENLLDVQDALIESIFKQLTEDIFNKAFTNW